MLWGNTFSKKKFESMRDQISKKISSNPIRHRMVSPQSDSTKMASNRMLEGAGLKG